jgi:hypothetical protein
MRAMSGCTIQDFMAYMRHHCHTPEDRGHCVDILNELPLTDSEKAYCLNALERFIRWNLPRYAAMDLPPPGPRAVSMDCAPFSINVW